MKRLIAVCAVFATVLVLAWYAGVDYTHRGFLPAYAIFCALVFGGLAATCPFLEKKEKQ